MFNFGFSRRRMVSSMGAGVGASIPIISVAEAEAARLAAEAEATRLAAEAEATRLAGALT